MGIASHQLEAFHAVARSGNFSAAAKILHVTQSALSQRVINLEDELGVALFVRDPAGARLTAAGEDLLRYCRAREALEGEFLSGLKGGKDSSVAGSLRIAGYSTVMRSLVIPALRPLVTRNPRLQIEIMVREVRELPPMLRHGEADIVLIDKEMPGQDLRTHHLGFEQYVLVAPRAGDVPDELFLDHDMEDRTTQDFFRAQKATLRPKSLQRRFLDDIYGILDGVRQGWGRAVVPQHLIEAGVDVAEGFKPLPVPIVMHDYHLPYYPRAHAAAIDILVTAVPRMLGAGGSGGA